MQDLIYMDLHHTNVIRKNKERGKIYVFDSEVNFSICTSQMLMDGCNQWWTLTE